MEHAIELLARAGDGAFLVSNEQTILFWSDRAEELLGYSRQEAVGKKCYALLKGCDRQGRLICRPRGSIISQVAEGDTVCHFELLAKHRDGRCLLIGMNTIPTISNQDENGGPGLAHLFYVANEQPAGPGMLRISLLGQTKVERPDGTFVQGPLWQRVKVRALFVMLALQQGRPVTRNKIIEKLWPGHSYNAALRNLNTTVYNLRRCIEPTLKEGCLSQYILYDGGKYSMAGDPIHWFDIKAFEKGIRCARQQENAERAIGEYKQAIALYRGDYLSDLADSYVYCYSEQQRFQELYICALEELGILHEEQGRNRKAKNLYLKALAVDSCRETACQRLMQLAIRNGDRTSAALYGHRLRSAMARELNVWPSQKTQRIYDLALNEL